MVLALPVFCLSVFVRAATLHLQLHTPVVLWIILYLSKYDFEISFLYRLSSVGSKRNAHCAVRFSYAKEQAGCYAPAHLKCLPFQQSQGA